MLRSDLVARIADLEQRLTTKQVEAVVNAILGRITDALVANDRVELRGFGTFTVKVRNAYTGRNPRTRAEVPVTDKLAPVFKTGRTMQARLNASTPPDPAELEGSAMRRLWGT